MINRFKISHNHKIFDKNVTTLSIFFPIFTEFKKNKSEYVEAMTNTILLKLSESLLWADFHFMQFSVKLMSFFLYFTEMNKEHQRNYIDLFVQKCLISIS